MIDENDIAIIALSGRFPSGNDVESLWEVLINNETTVKQLSKEAIQHSIHAPYLSNPNYVYKCSVLSNPDVFDANRFNMSPADAMICDPQQRIFLTCCLEVLDLAGYPNPEQLGIRTGVYGGCSISTYLLYNLLQRSDIVSRDPLQLLMSVDKDYLSTRVAYKLNLKGPALTIQTACSTSLVAIHNACMGLLNGEIDLALAGGSSVSSLGALGYLYTPDGIRSPDGFCRPFDINASGTIFGDGVGVVALTRLKDAVANRNHIYAVIKGSATNNDGAEKVGYSAPSIDGQSNVINEALYQSGLIGEDIHFIEAHGTGTKIGDPIEVLALTKAFNTTKKEYCALGSIKSNVGHLDTASGVVGVIKAALSLKYKVLPATINFTKANPRLNIEETPFFVCSQNISLPKKNEIFAGVSSFGVGGTNAHVVLSSYNQSIKTIDDNKKPILYLWSATTEKTLDTYISNTIQKIQANTEEGFVPESIAYSLKNRYTYALKAAQVSQGLPNFEEPICKNINPKIPAEVVLMLTGQDVVWQGKTRKLYLSNKEYKNHVDRLSEKCKQFLLKDVREYLLAKNLVDGEIGSEYTQASLFIIMTGIYQLLKNYSVKVSFLLGHSIGEIIASYIAGSTSEDSAIEMICTREILMENTEPGAMLSLCSDQMKSIDIPNDILQEIDIAAINTPFETIGVKGISEGWIDIAAINTPFETVYAGHTGLIDRLKLFCDENTISNIKISNSKAFHSRLMQQATSEWQQSLDKINFQPITIPIVSNITGKILNIGFKYSTDYWVNHLKSSIQFESSVRELINVHNQREANPIFLEIGPGNSLVNLVNIIDSQVEAFSISDSDGQITEYSLLSSISKLWTLNVSIDLDKLISNSYMVPIPTIPLNEKSYWLKPDNGINYNNPNADIIYKNSMQNNVSKHSLLPDSNSSTLDVTDIEKILQLLWEDVLQLETIDLNHDYFTLGGDSVQAIEICVKAKDYGLEIQPQDFFQYPTIKKLSQNQIKNINNKNTKPNSPESISSLNLLETSTEEEIDLILEQIETD